MSLKASIRATFVLAAALFATGLLAGEVAYWSPNAASANREFKTGTGKIKTWDWVGGVKFTDEAGLDVTVARDSVIAVRRDETDRTEAFQDAVMSGSAANVARVGAASRDEMDKEEGMFLSSEMYGHSGDWTNAVKGYQAYIKSYPKGNYALEARIRVATSLTSGATPSPASIQEAEKLLDEALVLGGEYAKARAGVMLGKILADKKDNKGAADKYAAAAEAAGKILHHEVNIQALIGIAKAAQASNDAATAKARFSDALKVPMLAEYSRVVMGNARGEAHMGLAAIAGKNLEGYQGWLAASCWFAGTPREGECLIKALEIAESLKDGDEKTWGERAKQIRESCRRVASAELMAYDKAKGG